jgi:acyl carrier protein
MSYGLLGIAHVSADTPLMDAGVDSLTAVEFRNSLSKPLGITLPSTLVFDHPSITAISDYMKTRVTPQRSDAPPHHRGTVYDMPMEQQDAQSSHVHFQLSGFASRFPGSSSGPDTFFASLMCGTHGGTQQPFCRWDVHYAYDPDPSLAAKSAAKHGCFIQGWELFDNRMYGISTVETLTMDPTHRIML